MEPSQFYNNSIFWIEVDKIKPNPYQPRREFDEARLRDLSDSIKMYGVLQPLVVTRHESQTDEGGLTVSYELISGERRWRASKLAGLREVPALIRAKEESETMKLELAIIENLQREDLNAVDRAKAFEQLAKEFGLKHNEIAKKVGKSREYVSNTLRLLQLPEEMLNALVEGKISEGHTRPLLMLIDRKEEQMVLFKEIIFKKVNVREAEAIARKVAFEKARKKERMFDPDIVELEEKLAESLGTRVQIEQKEKGGRVMIDFFSSEDLQNIYDLIKSNQQKKVTHMMDGAEKNPEKVLTRQNQESKIEDVINEVMGEGEQKIEDIAEEVRENKPAEEIEAEAKRENDDDLYSLKNFSV